MDKKSVKKLTEGLERDQLIEIISIMSSYSSKASDLLLNYCTVNNSAIVYDERIDNLWSDVAYIVDEANEFGGCEEWKEDLVYSNIREIQEIIENHETSWQGRKVLVDHISRQLEEINSGFEDILTEVVFDLCKTDEERDYLRGL